jgi:hypothetical protein
MSFLPEVQLDETFGPFVAAQENFGFIPNLFRAQSLVPRVIQVPRTSQARCPKKEKSLSESKGTDSLDGCNRRSKHLLCYSGAGLIGPASPGQSMESVSAPYQRPLSIGSVPV